MSPKAGDRFVVVCRHCGEKRSVSTGFRAIYTGDKTAPKDLFCENDCACPKPASALTVVACDMCGESGKHWLGCDFIGLPEEPAEAAS